ncbi:GLE1-domain-containing protein [Testicularia cyperi]|uniref:mRNA export factor GLE1 n=1 Tax=Testicularia cyperi TaxID=1882483 RepID=A0A317XYC2_9BASI|nr:GLE1-domain-containing protein [Testicularia cyperi]
MKYTIDSASEASADEGAATAAAANTSLRSSATPVKLGSGSGSKTTPASGSTPTSSTHDTPKRRGILRNPSSTSSKYPSPITAPVSRSAHRQATPTTASNTPLKHFNYYDDDEDNDHLSSSAADTPRRRIQPSPHTSISFQLRRRSTTPAFELVGVASSSSAATTRSPAASPSINTAGVAASPLSRQAGRDRLRSVPSWMRNSLPRMSRVADPDFDSSFEEDADEREEDASDSYASEVDSQDGGQSSPITSSLDSEEDSPDLGQPSQPGSRPRSKRSSPVKKDTGIRMAAADDEWDEWNRTASQLAWQRARLSQNRRTRPDQDTKLDAVSPLHFKGGQILPDLTTQFGLGSNRGSMSKAKDGKDHQDELDQVQKLLSSLSVRRTQEEREAKEAFEARNKALWEGIDASILAAERTAREAQAAEAARLEAARKAQAEAERKAKELREQEQLRIEAEKRAQQEDEDRKRQAAEQAAKDQADAAAREEKEKAMGGSGADVRRAAEQEYREWMDKIGAIKRDVLPAIAGNPELRKQCFAAKRQITPKVGQLTNSRQEIVRITEAIGGVLTAAKQASVAAASGSNATGDVYVWILNHLSKCLIRQAEQEVAAKQDTAYPLARVVVWLVLSGHTQLADVLMARLVKKCPWVLAVWPPRSPTVDEADYRKLLGYKGSDETTENYSNRMCGIFAFYVAILQTEPTPPPGLAPSSALPLDNLPERLRPKTLWIWCTRSLTPASPFLSHPLAPSLWATLLEVAGNRALDIYGRQMHKLFRLLLDQGLNRRKAPFVENEAQGNVKAAMVRLELLLQDWAESGRIKDATKGSHMDP